MPNRFYSAPAPDTSLFAEAALGMLREEQQAKRAYSIPLVPPRIAPSLLSSPAPTYPSITVFPATPDTIAARNQHLLFHSIRHLDEPHQHHRDVAKSAHRGKKALKQLAPLPGNKQTGTASMVLWTIIVFTNVLRASQQYGIKSSLRRAGFPNRRTQPFPARLRFSCISCWSQFRL